MRVLLLILFHLVVFPAFASPYTTIVNDGTILLGSVPALKIAVGHEMTNSVLRSPHAEGTFAPEQTNVRASPQRRLPSSQSPLLVVLEYFDTARFSAEILEDTALSGGNSPLRIGMGREVRSLKDSTQMAAQLTWTTIHGGLITALNITSPDALGLRLGLLVEKLPTTALLRFYAPKGGQVFEVSGKEVTDTIARNAAAGDSSEEGRSFWSPVIEGPTATLEIELQTGAFPNEVVFSLPHVSHLFSSPLNNGTLADSTG